METVDDDPGQNPADVLVQPLTRNAFANTDQPRPLAGVTANGRLLLIVVDGRQPEWSIGLGFDDTRALQLHFDVVTAMNMDRGGSSSLTAHGVTVNASSDGQARAVSDSVAFIVGARGDSIPPSPNAGVHGRHRAREKLCLYATFLLFGAYRHTL